ncbi:MAG: transcriptional repressor NrdR [Synechococcaceae cyanobacterium RL_1_2]|nr:transcriptional repressor NrdR [Synechococcaceae cyanobacterium RL_1_2]
MLCPRCNHPESRVLESRSTEAGKSVRRRRECLDCNHRFTTYERVECVPITVVKRDNKRELFDRSKLLRGLSRACEKTDVPYEQLEYLVDEIEGKIQQSSSKKVTTDTIGDWVLSFLKETNEVAYIRFASVYGKFQGIKDFIETLDKLQATNQDNYPQVLHQEDEQQTLMV